MNCEYGCVSAGGEERPYICDGGGGLDTGVAGCWTSSCRFGGEPVPIFVSSSVVATRVMGDGSAPCRTGSFSASTWDKRADLRGFFGSVTSPAETWHGQHVL